MRTAFIDGRSLNRPARGGIGVIVASRSDPGRREAVALGGNRPAVSCHRSDVRAIKPAGGPVEVFAEPYSETKHFKNAKRPATGLYLLGSNRILTAPEEG